MTDLPLVSVVLPTYNRAALLPRAVSSVLSQTYQNLELIIVDDASTDATAELIGTYDDERLHFVRLERRAGAAAARNHGIRRAKGALVAFEDSDDVWDSRKLEWHVWVMEADASIGASVCSFDVYKDGRRFRIRHKETTITGDQLAEQLLMGTPVPTATVVARADALQEIGGFDEALPRRQDLDLCLRLARSHRFHLGGLHLVDNYVSADSISTDPAKYVEASERLFASHSDLFERLPRAYAFQVYNVAKHLAFTGHHDTALPYAQRAVSLDGSNRKARMLLLGLRTRTVSLLRMFSG